MVNEQVKRERVYTPFMGKYIVYETEGDVPYCPYSIQDEKGLDVPIVFDEIDDAYIELESMLDTIWEQVEAGELDEDYASEMMDYRIGIADMDDDGHVIIYDENGLILEFYCQDQF